MDLNSGESVAISVIGMDQAGAARRTASAMARSAGFDETVSGKLAIVASEIGMNLVKHARDGQIIFRRVDERNAPGIEILSIDRGPGMRDLAKCLRDGYTSAGTSGTGLGAMIRLSSAFDVYSLEGRGTVLVARFEGRRLAETVDSVDPQSSGGPFNMFQFGAVCQPCPGGLVSGDGWSRRELTGHTRIIVADGLGHGPAAAEASRKAVEVFNAGDNLPLVALIDEMHVELRPTRGAAVAIAQIDHAQQSIHYVAVGNIGGSVLDGDTSHGLLTLSGIVGHTLPRVQENVYTWPPGGLLVMYSDGIKSRWNLDLYPGLAYKNPSLVAGVLYRDFRRGTDDTTVVVVKERVGR